MSTPPPYPPSSPPAGSSPPQKTVVALLLFLTVAVGFLLAERMQARRMAFAGQGIREITPRGDLAADEQATVELFQQASGAVVHITTSQLAQRMFSRDVMEVRRGTGSGFVWDDQGHIVTNFHVVADSNEFRITFANQTTVNAELIGKAPHKDLAVLRVRIPPEQLTTISVGESSNLLVGQKVFAIGNPFGLDQTLTTGVVSGLGREIRSKTQRPISGMVQTNAAINPGNSGGPLLDSAGRLIGVNTAIFSPSGTSAGVGFAIPVDIVRRVVPQLIQYQQVISPSLDVVAFDPNLLSQFGLKGVLVRSVQPGGAADQAGVQPFRFNRRDQVIWGDLIVAINDEPIEDLDDLYESLDQYRPGQEVTLQVVRNANTRSPQQLKIPIQLGLSD